MIRHKQKTEKKHWFSQDSKHPSQNPCYEQKGSALSWVRSLRRSALPHQGQLCYAELRGSIPVGQSFILLIFQGLVSCLIRATRDWLTPPRLTQGWFVNQKINLLIYSGIDSAIIYFNHARCQTLNLRPSHPWSYLILCQWSEGVPGGEAYLGKWIRFKEFLGKTESRQRELDDLWK